MKKYIWIPFALLAWLGLIAWFVHPSKNPDLSYTQYYVTIGITLVIIVFVSYFFKKREDRERKERENKRNKR